jgi:alpha/beta superfamily hydrolase
MDEERVIFESGDLGIEGLLEIVPGDRGVVVTHPHPLYGGDMYNGVVQSVVDIYRMAGYSTLRFNFRGVGASEGAHDNADGEQKDVESALKVLNDQGKNKIDLVGYSFGAWVNALGSWRFEQVEQMIMVSPPVSFLEFPDLSDNPKIELVIVGTRDEFADLNTLRATLRTWSPTAELKVIEGADHFYTGKLGELQGVLQEFLEGREESELK